MPNDMGIYCARASEEDAAFLREHFVEGTKWAVYEWGDLVGVFTVGDRFELGGRTRNHIRRERDGWEGEVFLDILVASPYSD